MATIVHHHAVPGLDGFRREFTKVGLFPAHHGKAAPTDVYTEGDHTMVVEVHLPKFAESDITVTVDHGSLVVQAERKGTSGDKAKKYLVRESSNSFHRSVALPEQAVEDKITADFTDGVLRVRIPLQDEPPRTISIGNKKKS